MSNRAPKKSRKELSVDQKITRRNFISFTVFGALGVSAYGGWRWLYNSPMEPDGGITGSTRVPLRRALNKTELAFRRVFSNNHLVKTYPKEMAVKHVRVNTSIGADSRLDAPNWTLQVKKLS